MKVFKSFSYKLDRTFAISLAMGAALLLYLSFQASRSNTVFFAFGILLTVLMCYFIYLGIVDYRRPKVTLKEGMEIYSGVCPNCKEMVKSTDTSCPHCHHSLKA